MTSGLNLVKAEGLPEFAVTRQRPRAQAHHSDAAANSADGIHRQSHTAVLAIISGWPLRRRISHELQAMSDPAVLEEVEMSERVIRVMFKKREHAKKGAGFLHQILGLRMGVGPERGGQNEQPGGKPQASEQAPIAKRLEGAARNPGQDEESKDAPDSDADREKPSLRGRI